MKSGSPLAVAAALLLLVAALTVFYTRGNGFPYYYHNDEPSKVAQIISEHRNFYHPQLLMVATEAVLWLEHSPRQAQPIAVAGRTASAAFAAAAVGLLALLAYRLRGLAAAGATAALAATHPLLFELAHYMKEDCAWLFGLAAFYLAAWALETKPTAGRAMLLGAAAGLATSGKYLGIMTLPAGALFLVWLNGRSGARRTRWLSGLAIGFLAAFCVINWDALIHPLDAYSGLRSELTKIHGLAAEESGWVRWKAVGKYLKHAWPAEAPLAVGFSAWFVFAPSRWRARERTGVEWLLVLLPLALLVALFFAPRIFDRYVLPIVETHALLAALGAWEIGALAARRWGMPEPIAIAILTLLAVAPQWSGLADCQRELRTDPRAELSAWLSANVPPNALVAHDPRALLTWGRQEGNPAFTFPQPTIQSSRCLADLGSLQTFEAWGVRWFVVADEDYDALLHPPSLRVNAAQTRARYDAFYGQLFARARAVWERPRGRLIYLHPALRVMMLPASQQKP